MLNFEDIVKNNSQRSSSANRPEFKTNLSVPSLKTTIFLNIAFIFILALGYIYNPVAINIKNANIYIFSCIMIIILYVINIHFFVNKIKKVILVLLFPLIVIIGLGAFFQAQTWPIWDNGAQYYKQIGKIDVLDQEKSKKFAFDLNKNYVVNKEMALRIADKKMGVNSLSSQYQISDATLQKINYKNQQKLFWVVNLEYNNFWSQFSNQKIANVILVDANRPQDPAILLDQTAKGEKFNIRLSKTGILDQNLNRMVQLRNPFYMLTDYSFELDDDLVPHYIVTHYVNKRGFDLKDVKGIIDINLQTNAMKVYNQNQVPSWVDRVNPISLVQTQITNNGEFVHGLFNFSNRDKFILSNENENFIYLDNEPFYISGITSPSSDQSLIGIIAKSLKRDKTYKINIDGAVEQSAMKSAEGKVQNYNYKAISPIIIHSTNWKYLIPLVDNENLIKSFALVDIQNYQNVKLFDTIEAFVNNESTKPEGDVNSTNSTGQTKIDLKSQLENKVKAIQEQLNELKKLTNQVK